MKILATSDMHGMLDGIDVSNVDVICFSGDIAPLKKLGHWHKYAQAKWVRDIFCKWMNEHPDKQFVFTLGNHDFFTIEKFDEFKIDWPSNAHLLLDSEVTINNVKFYGTPWVPIISYSWAFEADHDILKEKFSHIPYNVDVLLSHSPPHIGTDMIDRSLQYGMSRAFGSNELAEQIIEKKPKYVFCGHIHSGIHDIVKFFDTQIANVSRVNEDYNIEYNPMIIEI